MRLIDADGLYEDFMNDLLCIKFGSALMGTPRSEIGISNVLERIEDAPTIEAEPVRRGKWEIKQCGWSDYDCQCSVCGASGVPDYKYCHKCGAKMDLEE